MQYDLAILIPTYKRNQDLFDAIGSVYKAVLTSNMKICIMIIDNDVDNNINFTEFNDLDIFYQKNEYNIGGRGSFDKLLRWLNDSNYSEYGYFLTDDDILKDTKSIINIYNSMRLYKDKNIFQFNGRQFDGKRKLNSCYSHALKYFGKAAQIDSFRVMSGCAVKTKAIPTILDMKSKHNSFDRYAYPMQFLALCKSKEYIFIRKETYIHKIGNETFWDYESQREGFWLNRIEVLSKLISDDKNYEVKLLRSVFRRFVSRNLEIYTIKKNEIQRVDIRERSIFTDNKIIRRLKIKQKIENIIIKISNLLV